MMKESPSRTAAVFKLPASLPDSFSERANAMNFLPVATSRKNVFFCSSLPPIMIGNEPSALTAYPTPTPPQALLNSSTTRQSSNTPYPAPPYSLGIQTPIKPYSMIFFMISVGYSPVRSNSAACGRTYFPATSRARCLSSRCSGVNNSSMIHISFDACIPSHTHLK